MTLTIERYNERATSALTKMAFQEIEAFAPTWHARTGFPTHVLAEEQIYSFMDWNDSDGDGVVCLHRLSAARTRAPPVYGAAIKKPEK